MLWKYSTCLQSHCQIAIRRVRSQQRPSDSILQTKVENNKANFKNIEMLDSRLTTGTEGLF